MSAYANLYIKTPTLKRFSCIFSFTCAGLFAGSAQYGISP
ncbi:hypothetical protein Cst_c22030 [Thermoclostridium stercorarium subsp. stercorarium DSM 8532]|uniref:Uncharacterized protein n=1 Tax=Thermoclostridium stercorarium (strain ATCC 35414 / DSM 8532 / NCIMB 11754) TaxID=1121335 RepID=L7VLW1_THES1|nr:hypothetical protein Cst_c22030 [Thermoclostridium stercorarium subsp. stercorarium DSM 8532]